MIGNCLQAWERHGWPAGQRYWLWRDRKGLLNHPLALLTNLLFVYGAAGWATARAGGKTWELGADIASSPWLGPLLWANALMLVWRQLVRGTFVGRVYGWLQGLTVPLRAPWANWISTAATMRAIAVFLRAKMRGRALNWSKTHHVFPEMATYGGLDWLTPDRVQPELASILPEDVSAGMPWLAVELQDEKLLIAGPTDPPPHAVRRLAMRIGREVLFQRVSWRNFHALEKKRRPAAMVKGQEMAAGRP